MSKDRNNVCTIAHGKYNFSTTSGSIYVSAVTAGQPINAGFVMPKNLYKENTASSRFMQAHVSSRSDVGGGFNIGKTLSVPNGHILKLINNRKKNGRDYLNAALLVLVHENAGLLSIKATIPANTKNAIGSTIEVFCGKGIILGNVDAVGLGIELQNNFITRYRNRDELEEGFRVHEVSKGITVDDLVSITKANGIVDISTKRIVRKRKIVLV